MLPYYEKVDLIWETLTFLASETSSSSSSRYTSDTIGNVMSNGNHFLFDGHDFTETYSQHKHLQTSFYLDCSSKDPRRVTTNCALAKTHWLARNLDREDIVSDQLCPVLRYVFLKNERIWFKCCGPKEIELHIATVEIDSDMSESGVNMLADFRSATSFGMLKIILKIRGFFTNVKRTIASTLTGGVGPSTIIANFFEWQKTFSNAMKNMAHQLSDQVMGKFRDEKERADWLDKVNRLTCRLVQPVAAAMEEGNMYLDGKSEMCFQTENPGYDPVAEEFHFQAKTECIHMAGPGQPGPVILGKVAGQRHHILLGVLNSFSYGPSKRRYEVVFL